MPSSYGFILNFFTLDSLSAGRNFTPMSIYAPRSSAALRKATSIGSLKSTHRQPVKSCDDINCSGSWNTPRIGPLKPQIGDIYSIPMSIYTPFKTLLGIKVKDSDSYYTAGGTKGARPCIVFESSELHTFCVILLMASFDKSEEDDVPLPFKRFLIRIPTSRRPIKGNTEHIHTTPEWENAPQYLVLIPVKCPKSRLGGRWRSQKVDSSKRNFEFYLDNLAMGTLGHLVAQKIRHWEEIGKFEHSRAEFLKQLDNLKEGHAKLTLAKSQTARSQLTGLKHSIRPNLPSLAETPEEKADLPGEEGWSPVIKKRRRTENKASAARSVKSRP